MTKKLIIDPPSGWKYGFPRPYDNPSNIPIEQWLVEHGYPQEEIDRTGLPYVRFFDSEVEEEDD